MEPEICRSLFKICKKQKRKEIFGTVSYVCQKLNPVSVGEKAA